MFFSLCMGIYLNGTICIRDDIYDDIIQLIPYKSDIHGERTFYRSHQQTALCSRCTCGEYNNNMFVY